MRLTAAGARLAAKAAGILEGARRLKEDVAGEPEVPRGPVRVGAGEEDSDSRGVPVPGSRGAKPA